MRFLGIKIQYQLKLLLLVPAQISKLLIKLSTVFQ